MEIEKFPSANNRRGNFFSWHVFCMLIWYEGISQSA